MSDTRDRIKAAAMPGWEWHEPYGLVRGEAQIGQSDEVLDEYPETEGPRVALHVGRGLYATPHTPSELRSLAAQFLAVADAMEPRPKTPCRVWVVRECDHDRQDIVAIYTTAAEAQADCERRQAEHCAAVEAGDAWPLDFDVEEHRITPSATAPQPS